MKDLNRLNIIGRITKDCTFGYLNSGSAKADFSIAVNDKKKNGNEWVDEVSYFNLTVWGKTAENLKPYLVKGRQVAIDGKLKQDRWEKDGKTQSAIKIIVENIQILGGGATTEKPKNQSENVSYEGGEFSEDVPF